MRYRNLEKRCSLHFNFCSKFDTVPCNLQPAFTTSGIPQGSYFLLESDSQGFIFCREFSGVFNSIGMKCYSRIIVSVNYRAGSMIWVLRGPSRAPKAQGWRRPRRPEYMGVPPPQKFFSFMDLMQNAHFGAFSGPSIVCSALRPGPDMHYACPL